MQILITKDGATKVPREVGSREEALAFVSQGFHVEAQLEDGSYGPLAPDEPDVPVEVEPAEAPAQKPAPRPAAKKAVKAAPAPAPKRKR